MEPLVSVVVPVFNGLPHLVDLTASILAQTHTNLEVVFTEGGSSDKSPEFLATLTDPRVQVQTQTLSKSSSPIYSITPPQ